MKTKILVTLLSGLISTAFAQQVPQPTPLTTTPQVAATQGATPTIGEGNQFEKEVTPLLRQISRKKALLELRRLDRELEKIDEDALKANEKKETPANTNGPMGGITPQPYNPFQGQVPSLSTVMEPEAPPVKILMIYGFEDNLYAKVSAGNQGGYVVRAGDILPDGRKVGKVTQNFIEVIASQDSKKKGVERIFVSAPEKTTTTSPQGGNQGSTNVAPSSNQSPLQAMPNGGIQFKQVQPIAGGITGSK